MQSSTNKKHILYPLINIAGIAGLLLAAGLISHQLELVNKNQLNPVQLAGIFLIFCLGYMCAVQSWRVALSLCSGKNISFPDSAADMGITQAAKYLPGKIWGMFARHKIASNRLGSADGLVHALAIEQICFFSAGLTLSIPALYFSGKKLVFYSSTPVSLSLLTLSAVGITLTAFLLRNKIATKLRQIPSPSLKWLYPYGWSLINWLLDSLSLALIYTLLFPNTDASMVYLTSIAAFSLVSGMLAVFSPGGLGVREGAFVLLAGSFSSPAEAFLAVSIFRAYSTARDILAGGYSLIRLNRKTN